MNLSQIWSMIRRGCSKLLQFGGRDSRSQFWPFAGFVYLVTQLLAMIAILPEMFGSIFGALASADAMARAHPEDWVVERGPGRVSYRYVGDDPAVMASLMPDLSGMLVPIIIVSLLLVALLAAAITRRLHDRGHSGWWGLVPLALGVMAFWMFTAIIQTVLTPPGGGGLPQHFGLMLLANLAHMASVIILIVQLALAGRDEGNRFGPASDDSDPR